MSDGNRDIVPEGQLAFDAPVSLQIANTEKVLGRIEQDLNIPESEAYVWVEQFLKRNTNLDFKELQKEVLSHEKEELQRMIPDATDTLLNRLINRPWYTFNCQDDIRWKHFNVEAKRLWAIFHVEWTADLVRHDYIKSKWLLKEKELTMYIGQQR